MIQALNQSEFFSLRLTSIRECVLGFYLIVGPNGLTYGCHDLDPNREIHSSTKNRSTNPTIWLQPEDGPKRQVGEVRVVVAD